MDHLLRPPLLWAQATPDDFEMPLLALRRWFWGQTLSSPRLAPGSEGLGAWLLGLLLLLLAALIAQGPMRALGQLFDLPGHVRLIVAAVGRLRASARLVMILLGASVVSWTAALLLRYDRAAGLADLALLSRSRSAVEAALEQGVLSALTPLRDLFSLADLLPLLGLAAFVSFRFAADRWEAGGSAEGGGPRMGRATVAWVAASLYGLYRLAVLVASPGDLPMGGALYVEPVAVPAAMLIADGLLAAWVLVELRRPERTSDAEAVPVGAALAILPAAVLAGLLAMPARYLAAAAYLSLPYVPDGVARSVLAPMLGGWGLAWLQAGALLFVGLAGAVPWCGGGGRAALRGYRRMLRAEGGHLVGALAIGGLAAGAPSGLAYLLVLSLPPQPWVLPAADSYAHYATLAAGLGLLAALVELGGRCVPEPSEASAETRPEAVSAAS